jgi:hypothetical protein
MARLAGHLGQAEVGLTRKRVETTGRDGKGSTDHSWMRSADLALTVSRSQPGTARSAHDAAVVLASFANADAGAYQRGSIALHHHSFIGFFDRVDLRLFARAVSQHAPASEWPSMGGEESVRGLHEDLATGRSLWALQAEWWTAVPGTPRDEKLASLLRRQLALAAWVDTGGIDRPTIAIGRRLTALGIGLRFNQSDELTMRLDLGRPVMGIPSDQRRLRLLFTVSVRPRL